MGEQVDAIAEYDKKNPVEKKQGGLFEEANIFDNSGNIMNQMSEEQQQKVNSCWSNPLASARRGQATAFLHHFA